VEQVVIASPSNQVYALPADQTVFTETHELGFYAVNLLSSDSSAVEYFAVNLFDENESNIRPRDSIQIGRVNIAPTASQQVGQLELWRWLAVLVLLILLIEWQVYHRRQLIPRSVVDPSRIRS
jgi:hypothetical protein